MKPTKQERERDKAHLFDWLTQKDLAGYGFLVIIEPNGNIHFDGPWDTPQEIAQAKKLHQNLMGGYPKRTRFLWLRNDKVPPLKEDLDSETKDSVSYLNRVMGYR